MRLTPFPPIVFLACILVSALTACQSQPPVAPADEFPIELAAEPADPTAIPLSPSTSGDEEALPLLPEDAVDEGIRGLTALLTGDVGLNGASVTPPGYVASPASVTQAATIGQIALIRLRATASDATTTRTLYSDVRGPGGAYSSMTFLSNDTSEYKAVYVERNEDLSVRVHNRPSFSGVLNPPAADVNYSYETKAIEDSSEPNDDENAATVTDRITGGLLGLGSTATRSFYEYSASAKDKEDWFSTTLTEGARYRYRLTSYNPRYGTWGYTLKLYNAAGTQVGTTTTMAIGNAAGNLVTPVIPTTGTYYIQIVGTPGTKTNNSNVFYSLYGINVCQLSVPELLFFSQPTLLDRCVGTSGTWNVAVTPAATSYAWNFGAGMSPSTSTASNPTCTIAARGTFIGSLTTTSSCGASFTSAFTYTVGCNWARTVGTPSSHMANDPFATFSDVVVDSQNRAHIVGRFTGRDLQVTAQEPAGSCVLLTPTPSFAAFYTLLDRKGNLVKTTKLIEGSAFPTAIALTSDDDLRISGHFTGTGLDFDPGPGTLPFTSVSTMDGFCQAISGSTGELQWAVEYGGTSHEYAYGLMLDSSDAVNIVGAFYQTADFDPGAGTQSRTSAGDSDGYWLILNDLGTFSFIGVLGGTEADSALGIARDASTGRYITGTFAGTSDLNVNGTTTKVSAGNTDAFIMKYNAFPVLQWAQTWGAAGFDHAGAVLHATDGLRVVGGFQGTVDFDPGAGVVNRTSNTPTFSDAYLLGLSPSTGAYQWVSIWGGAANDTALDVALDPMNGNLIVGGTYNATVDFDPGAGTANRTSVGGTDIYVNVLNSVGNYVNASAWGTSGAESLVGVAMGGSGQLFPIGQFSAALDFNPGAGNSTITPRGVTDAFVMRLAADATY